MGHQSFSEKSQTRQVLQLVFDHLAAGSGVTLTQANGILTITATGGGGTVTSVGVSGSSGIGVSGSPITGSGTITLSLGAITPTSVSTGALTASGAISLPAASITRANLADGSACSVIGRSANSSGAVADISMGTNDRLLGRVSNVVGSTQLTAGMVPSALITSAMLRNSAARSVIGRSANSSGVPADIASTGARTFLADNSGGTSVAFRAIDSGDLPTGNWIGAINGTTICTTTNLVSVANAWEAVTGTIALPAAGTYLVRADVCAQLAPTAIVVTATIVARLYNVTAAAVIANSQVYVCSGSVNGVYTIGCGSITALVTVAGASTIRLEGLRRTDTGTTYTYSAIDSNAYGITRLTYVRIA